MSNLAQQLRILTSIKTFNLLRKKKQATRWRILFMVILSPRVRTSDQNGAGSDFSGTPRGGAVIRSPKFPRRNFRIRKYYIFRTNIHDNQYRSLWKTCQMCKREQTIIWILWRLLLMLIASNFSGFLTFHNNLKSYKCSLYFQ